MIMTHREIVVKTRIIWWMFSNEIRTFSKINGTKCFPKIVRLCYYIKCWKKYNSGEGNKKLLTNYVCMQKRYNFGLMFMKQYNKH